MKFSTYIVVHDDLRNVFVLLRFRRGLKEVMSHAISRESVDKMKKNHALFDQELGFIPIWP